MDAVILAAGRGTRMGPTAAPFHKPVLEVNGVPLVRQAVELAMRAGVYRPTVVVAPQNADVISDAIGELPATLIVQRIPRGPADALRIGMQVTANRVPAHRVLVLLSDNVMTMADVNNVSDPWNVTAVGVRLIPRAEAARYTRWQGGCWVEKVPFSDPDGPPAECWVGPFVGWRAHMERDLHEICRRAETEGHEALIGPHLNRFMRHPEVSIRVMVSSYDVGTHEAYLRATKGEK